MTLPLPMLGVPRKHVHGVVRVMLQATEVTRVAIVQDEDGTFTVEPSAPRQRRKAAPVARKTARKPPSRKKAPRRKVAVRKATKRKVSRKRAKKA